jgi:hypothetical protein
MCVQSSLYDKMQQQYDEKNIRRRVYDALNVLMAMDIISKDKKEIQWKGLPQTSISDVEKLKVLLSFSLSSFSFCCLLLHIDIQCIHHVAPFFTDGVCGTKS